jgi:hypothetical protein
MTIDGETVAAAGTFDLIDPATVQEGQCPTALLPA